MMMFSKDYRDRKAELEKDKELPYEEWLETFEGQQHLREEAERERLQKLKWEEMYENQDLPHDRTE